MTIKEANAAHWRTVWQNVVREVEADTAVDAPRIAFSFEPGEAS